MNKIGLCTFGVISGLLSVFSADGQIAFENNSFAEILQKAKQEKKLIFMDCYTSWCGPCKKMEGEVFSREDVGGFMNAHFVNYKKDMEKDEGKELAKTYQIKVYPTFLILNGDGEVQHRLVGGMDADKFIQNVREGMGENSLRSFSERYSGGERGAEFVFRYVELLSAAYMQDERKKVLHEYWETLDGTQKSSKANWELVKRFVRDIESSEYEYLVKHKADFDAAVGKEEVDTKIYKDLHPLISNHCNSMIFKDRPEDAQALENYRRLLKESGISDQAYLLCLLNFTQAYVDNQLGKALEIYREEFAGKDKDNLFSATLWLNGMLINKGEAKHCKEGLEAIRKTMKECGWEENNPMFMAIIEGLQKKGA